MRGPMSSIRDLLLESFGLPEKHDSRRCQRKARPAENCEIWSNSTGADARDSQQCAGRFCPPHNRDRQVHEPAECKHHQHASRRQIVRTITAWRRQPSYRVSTAMTRNSRAPPMALPVPTTASLGPCTRETRSSQNLRIGVETWTARRSFAPRHAPEILLHMCQ